MKTTSVPFGPRTSFRAKVLPFTPLSAKSGAFQPNSQTGGCASAMDASVLECSDANPATYGERPQPLRNHCRSRMAAIMMLLLVRILMFAAGFLLWAITSIFPMLDRIREGWDGLGYWQIGVPIVLVMQLGAALVSSERPSLSPLWVLAGHAL